MADIPKETHSRLQAMADEMRISLKELLELCERNGLELIARQARATDKGSGGNV